MDLNTSEIADEVKKKNILHWNYREFNELPIVVKTHGSHVREIYLKWNKLKTLPKWIGELKNLQNLYLSGNFIQKLPQEIKFSKLTVLDLNSNQLEFIPTSVANLITLKYLLLDDNYITRIPPIFSQLRNLEYLSICRNRLETLPEWLGSLEKLEDLIVDNNYLEELPNRLTLAPVLLNISVCSNRCFQKDVTESKNRNQKLQISPNEYDGNEEITIEFPSQLVKIHKISNNVVCTLSELALRKVYKNRYRHNLEIKKSPLNVKIIYEPRYCSTLNNDFQMFQHFFPAILMDNGPLSICHNYHCQEAIFTESWIIFRLGFDFLHFPTCAFFCSHRCASKFANFSEFRNHYFLNH
ncbi:leucine-rich repeat and death domain-containing protein 1-like isoform X2 [Leptopilina boulardi]|uniref:leucine-rich repeat and death domain-containing protein 1-like isoform X2 n=1 Tax=Leptopilina boulardi TaxID=63433 RepID=UPI0021F66277|nr:leucine-rich repeat and death domain-containing protein 1-like isoform X2 [Leptopilina boulardi]